MTFRTLLHDRMGYDAIYAQSVVVAICGVAVEALAFVLVLALMLERMPSGLRFPGPEYLFSFARKGAFWLVSASLGYGMTFAVCQSLGSRPGPTRVVALLAAPMGVVVLDVVRVVLLWGDYGAEPLVTFFMGTFASYLFFGLPVIAASILAARKINKSRVNAEAVFGGPN